MASGIGEILKRLFSPVESEEPSGAPSEGQAQGEAGPGEKPPDHKASEPGKIATAAKKVALLRKALEFESDWSAKMDQIHTARSMLLFMHQNVLLKFEHLHELGILGEASYATLSAITSKNQEILSSSDKPVADDPAALAQENESLRRQLKSLYEKHVKSDIISGKELALEEEKAKVQGRLDDLKNRYENLQKKYEHLQEENKELQKIEGKYKLLSAKAASADRAGAELEKSSGLLHELESQNRLLKSKVEHQERLIQAMSWGDARNQQIFDSITELGEEKKKLKRQLMGEGARSWEGIPVEEGEHGGVGALLKENRSLYEKLESTDATLEAADQAQPDQNPLSSMEGLQEDTFHLKELAQAKQAIESQLDEKNKRIHDVSAMMEVLRKENLLLKQALEAKTRKAEGLGDDPAKKKMMQTIVGLKKDNSRLQLEIENLHYVVSSVTTRNEAVESKLKQLIAVARENRRLKQELERRENLLADYKRKDDELKGMKKFCYQLQSEYTKARNEQAKAVEENVRLEEKIKKVRSEYEGMINEYNKLFEGE